MKYRVSPEGGMLFADLEKEGRSGHMGHALVEYAPGKVLAFYPSCSAEDARWKGHSGYGWMEFKRSADGGETWSEPMTEPNSKALFDRHCGRTFMCEKAVCTPSGKIVLFYLQCDMVTNTHIWEPYFEPHVAYSTDGGVTFTPAKPFVNDRGRIYDAAWHEGELFVLFFANPEQPPHPHDEEHEMRLYVSRDEGETFELRAVVPFQSTINCFYGNLQFTPEGRLMVYTYDDKDEHNLKYIVSDDKGFTWGANRRCFFEKRMRNPQIIRFKDTYFLHGRSGCGGKDPGHLVLYTSPDAIRWDEGQILKRAHQGWGAYTNNLIVHTPDGRERLLIHSSHAYRDCRTNVYMFWVDEA